MLAFFLYELDGQMSDRVQSLPDMEQPDMPMTAENRKNGIVGMLRSMELDLRLLGMVGALLLIWIVLDLLTGGRFITLEISLIFLFRQPPSRSWRPAWYSLS